MKNEVGLESKQVPVTTASTSVTLSKQDETNTLTLKYRNQDHINQNELVVNNSKLTIITAGLQKYIHKQLTEQVSKENCIIIAKYILAHNKSIAKNCKDLDH